MPTTKLLAHLGVPCWTLDNVSKAISRIAIVEQSRAHYFLASHAPMERIENCRTLAPMKEESLFVELFTNVGRDVLAIVQGDPGTGKSHLVFWLKLRCDDALGSDGFPDVQPVLIQRRSGSLKDALEQMIRQLPVEFARYLDPVRLALDKLSNATAKEMLANELRLELGERRRDRGKAALPATLKHLGETCASLGFRKWLTRPGATIDRVIRQLTETSDIEDRCSLPEFVASDFEIDDLHRRDNVRVVGDLALELEDDESLREEAASFFNDALPAAVKELTGLGKARLREIFDSIRRDLRATGKTLALFIEDVSVMSALDEEVVNAVEPQTRDDLCRLIAVVGMTDAGFQRLPDNLKERATHIVALGDRANAEWRSDKEEVARFAARYLNAVRLEEADVRKVAVARREGGDVPLSACTFCNLVNECHETFGSVELGGVQVGLFPFSASAPHRILNGLEVRPGVRKNPRGLLTHVLYPLLSDVDDLPQRCFPTTRLAASLRELPFWTGFENTYCGGWSAADKRRLRLVAQAWIEPSSADHAAELLKGFLKPFGFPEFAQAVRGRNTGNTGAGKKDKPKPPPPPEFGELDRMLEQLRRWHEAGEPYVQETVPRGLLADLIKNSIQWEDSCHPPFEVAKGLYGLGTKLIEIEGMRRAAHQSRLVITFPRGNETRDLLEALLQFRYAGGKTWNFEHAGLHKRVVARWLRKHENEIRAQMQPPLDVKTPIRAAIQFLSLAAIIRSRSWLSSTPIDVVSSLFDPAPMPSSACLSGPYQALLVDMSTRLAEVQRFLSTELNVPQGRTGGINFIDPSPVLDILSEIPRTPKIEVLAREYFSGHWESRYQSLVGLDRYTELESILRTEVEALGRAIDDIRFSVRSLGYTGENLGADVQSLSKGVLDLVADMNRTRFPVPDVAFERVLSERSLDESIALKAAELEKAESLLETDDPYGVLVFDVHPVKELGPVVQTCTKFIEKVGREVEKRRSVLTLAGDALEIRHSIADALGEISALSES